MIIFVIIGAIVACGFLFGIASEHWPWIVLGILGSLGVGKLYTSISGENYSGLATFLVGGFIILAIVGIIMFVKLVLFIKGKFESIDEKAEEKRKEQAVSQINNSQQVAYANGNLPVYGGSDEFVDVHDKEEYIDVADIEASFERLNNMIGLTSVKQEINRIAKSLDFERMRENEIGIGKSDKNYNFLFIGNPGTGKTSVARELANILYDFGAINTNHLIEADRSSFVGNHLGDSEIKTQETVMAALDGVLFIDEAYSLCTDSGDVFGKIAVDLLVNLMTKYKGRLCVIMAGYEKDMKDFLAANEGLSSRFNRTIVFEDFTDDELIEIAQRSAYDAGYYITDDGIEALKKQIDVERANRDFGNARVIHNLLERAIEEKALNYEEGDDIQSLTAKEFGVKEESKNKKTLQDYLDELNGLVGLQSVKDDVERLIALLNYQVNDRRLHLCFTGNPGTGKTTVARIYANILRELGYLQNGTVVETSRSDFVGQYMGHTAEKTKRLCERAYGGVLFIDEAYSLVNGSHDEFGMEAVNELIKQMEDNKERLVVIFAGYKKEMEAFFKTNSGIKSRIRQVIEFTDYTPDELEQIFWLKATRYSLTADDEVKAEIKHILTAKYKNRDEKFGNAREVENLVNGIFGDIAVSNMRNRESRVNITLNDLSKYV